MARRSDHDPTLPSHLTRREMLRRSLALAAGGLPNRSAGNTEASRQTATVETQYFRLALGVDGTTRSFIEKGGGQNWLRPGEARPFARIRRAGTYTSASSLTLSADRMLLSFAPTDVHVVLNVLAHGEYLVLEVHSIVGAGVQELVFVDVQLALDGTLSDPFYATALALGLKTNVHEIPGPSSGLFAQCFSQFGMVGAAVAIVACPRHAFRRLLKQVVLSSRGLLHSLLGGPFAMGQSVNRASYLISESGFSTKDASDWIRLSAVLGTSQIDLHAGATLRHGDLAPSSAVYPKGFASVRAAVDRMHVAGLKVGLHTYSFFIAKNSRWVSPIPDRRLAKTEAFTLDADLSVSGTTVYVMESTRSVSTRTGFLVRNSVTLQIDDELMTFNGATSEAPFAFTGCIRGACGTLPAVHQKGAKVHPLKECFGLFAPDPAGTLFEEVAEATANAFNRCGFDMLYFDALDGQDVLSGRGDGWHHGSRFVFEVCKRLRKHGVVEMSTMQHHLWCVRSRFGAWDRPRRNHKRFVDLHCASNRAQARILLPSQLGWWTIEPAYRTGRERMFCDDIEYLMSKCLATDAGFSVTGVNPSILTSEPGVARLASIFGRYEELRVASVVPERIKRILRVPGDEFTLKGGLRQGWQFIRTQYVRHRAAGTEASSSRWQVTNRYGAQPLRVRIEALPSVAPFDEVGGLTLAHFASPQEFPIHTSAPGVMVDWAPTRESLKVGSASARIVATNGRGDARGAWTRIQRTITPAVDLGGLEALGLWVHGDGRGEILGIELQSPSHVSGGTVEHQVLVDFVGWRYFELGEPGLERSSGTSSLQDEITFHTESVDYSQVGSVALTYSNLPPAVPVTCLLSELRALPLREGRLVNPSMRIANQAVTFPAEVPSGHFLEWLPGHGCVHYGSRGEPITEILPSGPTPIVYPGDNPIEFATDPASGARWRANVTLILSGDIVQ